MSVSMPTGLSSFKFCPEGRQFCDVQVSLSIPDPATLSGPLIFRGPCFPENMTQQQGKCNTPGTTLHRHLKPVVCECGTGQQVLY